MSGVGVLYGLATMASSSVALDPAIRDWVLVPILLFVVLVTHARLYAMKLLSPPPEGHIPVDSKGAQQRALIAYSQRLRMYGGYVSQRGWAMRKSYLIGTPDKGLLDSSVKDANAMANVTGPGSMDMMKMQVRVFAPAACTHRASLSALPLRAPPPSPAHPPLQARAHAHNTRSHTPLLQQMLNMGYQFGIGMIVGNFFSGFVTLRLPFSLTERFKAITQQGVGVPGLDSSFVSTMSWFYICLFGLQVACIRLLSKGGSSAEEAQLMQMQMGMGMQQQQGQPFMGKQQFAQEAEAHKLTEWAPTPLLLGERSLLQEAISKGLNPVPVTSMAWAAAVKLSAGSKKTD